MPDLARILREQAEAAEMLRAGHEDVRGLKLWLSDLTAEEVLIRMEEKREPTQA